VSDAVIARVASAARQNAHGEAALAIIGQLGSDVSALSFAGLADLLTQLRAIGMTEDANAIALEALQVWKAL
jgi:glycerate kinase